MDTQAAHALLEQERSRLQDVSQAADSLTSQEAPRAEFVEHDGIERVGEALEREIDTSVAQRIDLELEEVAAALVRIEAGTYGICEVCGQPVPDPRLEALPATRYCVEDQARVEREPWLRASG